MADNTKHNKGNTNRSAGINIMSDTLQLGQNSKTIIDSTDGAQDWSADPVYCIEAINGVDVVLTVTDALDDGFGSGSVSKILAGTRIYGRFIAATIVSGEAVCYKLR